MPELPGLEIVRVPASGPPILHVDADAFYVSVEQRDDPALRDRPVAVVTDVVCCASYEARAARVRSGMSEDEAHARCPELVIVAPRWDAYAEASGRLFDLLVGCAEVVDAPSSSEAFLDLDTDDWDDAADDGDQIRRRVRTQLGLPISIGIGRTKLLAKIANGRAKPDGLVVIGPEREPRVRASLRIDQLWGVGRVTCGKLAVQGIANLADVKAYSARDLAPLVGRSMARRLDAMAHGQDDARVLPRRPRTDRGVPAPRPVQLVLAFELGRPPGQRLASPATADLGVG
jgi:DNA polymerase-4